MMMLYKNRICGHRYRWRRRAVAATRRQQRAITHGVLYTRTTPVAAARAELGGRIATGTRLSRRRARPSRIKTAVPERRCGGGWSSAVKVRRVAVRRRVIGLQLQLRLIGGRRCVGGPAAGGLRNNHATCLSNENSDNADNPS